jgi:hypothetical protein
MACRAQPNNIQRPGVILVVRLDWFYLPAYLASLGPRHPASFYFTINSFVRLPNFWMIPPIFLLDDPTTLNYILFVRLLPQLNRFFGMFMVLWITVSPKPLR